MAPSGHTQSIALGLSHRSMSKPKGRNHIRFSTCPHSLLKNYEVIMDQHIELTLEQQFNLRSFQDQVARMSREQAQQFLVKLYEQMMLRETMYKHFLKHQWGIESSPNL